MINVIKKIFLHNNKLTNIDPIVDHSFFKNHLKSKNFIASFKYLTKKKIFF